MTASRLFSVFTADVRVPAEWDDEALQRIEKRIQGILDNTETYLRQELTEVSKDIVVHVDYD